MIFDNFILLCMRRFEPAQFTADVIHMLLKIFKLSADVIHGDPDIPMEQFYGIEGFLQFVPDVHVFLQQIQYAGLAHAVSKGLCRAMFFSEPSGLTSQHLMFEDKPYLMFVRETLSLLAGVHQAAVTDPVDAL